MFISFNRNPQIQRLELHANRQAQTDRQTDNGENSTLPKWVKVITVNLNIDFFTVWYYYYYYYYHYDCKDYSDAVTTTLYGQCTR